MESDLTLIIPASGKSSRFPNMKPKWLLTHPNGKLMIELVLEGITKNNRFSRIIITILKAHVEKYEADVIMAQMFESKGYSVELLVLDEPTSSAVDTVYQTLSIKDVTGPFVIKDSDNYVECQLGSGNFVVGASLYDSNFSISNIPAKSFIILDSSSHIISGIVEKEIVSQTVSLGVYGFESGALFKETCDKIFESEDYKYYSELYVSHVVAYWIAFNGSIFKYLSLSAYEDWGTLDDWNRVRKRNSTYFVDIDGVIMKNSGKYGKVNWRNNTTILEGNLLALKKISNEGGQIVFVTARGDEDLIIVKKILLEYEISYKCIVTDCNHATRILINDFAPTNPYPSSVAINIPRNGSLTEFLV